MLDIVRGTETLRSPVQTAKAVYRKNVKSTPFMAERLETLKMYQCLKGFVFYGNRRYDRIILRLYWLLLVEKELSSIPILISKNVDANR